MRVVPVRATAKGNTIMIVRLPCLNAAPPNRIRRRYDEYERRAAASRQVDPGSPLVQRQHEAAHVVHLFHRIAAAFYLYERMALSVSQHCVVNNI